VSAKANALGEFLRARRDQVRPEDVGLVPGGQRRAPGLRREELAMLAGISAEYYLRLERGRAQNPSPQILDALARALKLDLKATKYLHQLASPTTSRWDQSVLEVAAEGLDRLIDQCPFPAIWPVDTKTSWRRIRWPGRCRQDSPRDRTSCAGAF
jgi:transcriptional regulator with XRE-family HTH domain